MNERARRADPEVERLFLAFRSGDREALSELVVRTTPWLQAVARRCGARGAEVDEVVQDAWIEASAPTCALPTEVPLLVWMASLVHHRLAHVRRSQGRRARLHLVDGDSVDRAAAPVTRTDVVAIARGREMVDIVRTAVDELPPHYRDVLYLHLFEGLTPLEVARRLGLGRVAVRLRLFRGLRRLRRALPDALALLLLAGLARHGRSQAPWWLAAAAAASLAGGYVALAEPPSPPPPLVAFAPTAEPGAAALAAVSAVPAAVIAPEERQAAAVPALLTVVVRDAAGAPLPGVGIELAPVAGLDPLVHLHRAYTGADGIATFAALPPVTWRLRTDRGVGAEVLPQQGSQRLELQAPAGRTVRGQVVDAEGQPVPGAAIWLATRADEPLVGTAVMHCDAAGTFTLAAVPAAAAIAARAPGRGRIAAVPVPADGWCSLVLGERGGRVEGAVVAGPGRPVADALVVVGVGREGASPRVGAGLMPDGPPPYCLRTDADGGFRVEGLEPGLHPVVVRHAGNAPFCAHVAVVAGGTATVRAWLQEGASLRGRVVDAAGVPSAGAAVVYRGEHAIAAVDVRTDAAGEFELASLPAGPATLTVSAAEAAPVETSLSLAPGAQTTTVVLETLVPWQGTVRGATGESLAGWRLALPRRADRRFDAQAATATVDAMGQVALPAPAQAAWQNLLLQAPGSTLWWPVGTACAVSGTDHFDVRVPAAELPRASLQLFLQDAEARPIGAANIWSHGDGEPVCVGRTDAAGRCDLGPLRPGAYRLIAAAPSPDQPAIELPPITLGATEARVVRCTAPATGRLEFALHFPDGTAPKAPLVFVYGGSKLAQARATTARGAQVLAPGHYVLSAVGDGFVPVGDAQFEVRAGEVVRIDHELRRAARRTLSMRNLPGAGAGRFTGRFFDAVTNRSLGRFDLPLDQAAPMPLMAFLPMGSIRLEGVARGLPVRAQLEFVDLLPDYSARSVGFEAAR